MSAVLVIGFGAASPAWAVPPADLDPVETLPHCVVTAVEVGNDAALPAPRCFETFAEAIAEATDGRVLLPKDAQSVDQDTLDDGIDPDGLESSLATVIGIEYEHKSFGGWSYVIQSTNSRGCVGYSYRVSTLPGSRNNAISSARTYGGCRSAHYSGTYFTGSRYLCGCAQMGTMNDKTSSIFFSATGYQN